MSKIYAQIKTRMIIWLVLFLPVFFISMGFRDIHAGAKLRNTGIKTTATVISVSHRVSTDDDGNDTYYYTPIIKFIADDGIEYIRKLKETSYEYSANRTIEVIYISGRPNTVQHDHYYSLYGNGLSTLGLTLVFAFIVGGGFLGWFGKK